MWNRDANFIKEYWTFCEPDPKNSHWKICLGFNFAHESTASAETTCFLSVIVDVKMI